MANIRLLVLKMGEMGRWGRAVRSCWPLPLDAATGAAEMIMLIAGLGLFVAFAAAGVIFVWLVERKVFK